MDRRVRNAVLECTGAIVGAGFASGREIMRFFSRYGPFSWIGIFLAAGVMGVFAYLVMKKARESNALSLSQLCSACMGGVGVAGTVAFAVLLGVTGGSMTAAAGELGSLALPVKGAYAIAFSATLLMGLVLTRRSLAPLAFVSTLLVPAVVFVFLLCFIPPAQEAATTYMLLPVWRKILETALFGLSYGGMNITLAAGVLCEIGQGMHEKKAIPAAVYLGLVLLALLALGNAVLLRQPELNDAALPIVMLLNKFGKMGFWLAIIGLYLAVFTTLMAVSRSFYNIIGTCVPGWLSFAITAGVFLLFGVVGFARLVGAVYPVLGFLCLLLLIWMLVCKRKPVKAARK